MNISEEGVAFIRKQEGCRLQTYTDSKGVLTVGVGHTGKDVEAGQTITSDQVNALLKADIRITEQAITRLVTAPLKQCMFDALCSLIFNIGQGRFAKSTLLKYLNQKNYLECSRQFLVFNECNGKPMAGLTCRREAERELFLKEGI